MFGEDWTSFAQPVVPDIRAIQNAVQEIAGTYDGQPILRLDWQPNVIVYRYGKRRHANTVLTVRAPKEKRFNRKTGIWEVPFEMVEICVPRWYVRQLVPRSKETERKWEEMRFNWEDRVVNNRLIPVRVDVMGPYPPAGLYKDGPPPYDCIAHHDLDRKCCYDRINEGEVCYGRYRDPDSEDVKILKNAWLEFLSKAPKDRLPGDQATEHEKAAIARDLYEKAIARDEQIWAGIEENILAAISRPFNGQTTVPVG